MAYNLTHERRLLNEEFYSREEISFMKDKYFVSNLNKINCSCVDRFIEDLESQINWLEKKISEVNK